MKTGATKQQIDQATIHAVNHWHRDYGYQWDGLDEVQQEMWRSNLRGWSPFLVPESHRIVSVEDLRAIRELAEPDFSTMHADERSMRLVAVLLARIDALIAGDGE